MALTSQIADKVMLPEEAEFARLEAEQADLSEQVTLAELELETAKTEAARFRHRYFQTVGRLYAELDGLNAEIAKAQTEQAPDDDLLKARAQAAKDKAQKTAEEAGLIEAQPKPPREISQELKRAYRQAAKLMHPDLAVTDHERQRRTNLMAEVNLAYEQGDQTAIQKRMEEFGQDPETIVGEDVGSRIVKAIRRIAQLRRRLNELQQEIDAQRKTEIWQLKKNIEEGEAKGGDPLGDLVRQLKQQVSERSRLNSIRTRPA
jgi:hypothetical protein